MPSNLCCRHSHPVLPVRVGGGRGAVVHLPRHHHLHHALPPLSLRRGARQLHEELQEQAQVRGQDGGRG